MTVHAEREPSLARRLSIHTLPCLVVLLDGNIFVYKDTITSVQRIIGKCLLYSVYVIIKYINFLSISELVTPESSILCRER